MYTVPLDRETFAFSYLYIYTTNCYGALCQLIALVSSSNLTLVLVVITEGGDQKRSKVNLNESVLCLQLASLAFKWKKMS